MRRWGLALAAALATAMQGCSPSTPTSDEDAEPTARWSLPAGIMSLYKNHISQVDATRSCRFKPTCGDYAREAIRKHGALLGWLMACDRAMRFHGDTGTYERDFHDGTRLLDPVSDNDFWLARPFARRQP